MHVLIPAGGRGTRLQPLTQYAPKPLLPLGDRPILSRIVEQVPAEWPVTVVVSPALAGDFRHWAETLCGSRNVTIYVERARACGARGPVVAVAECVEDLDIRDDLVLLMGDSLLPSSLPEFLGGSGGDALRLAAYRLPDLREAARFGVLEISEDGTVISLEEKPERPRSPWIFTGCLYIPRRLIPLLHAIAAGAPREMGHLVSGYLERGEEIEAYPLTGTWNDIGTFRAYLEAHRALLFPAQHQALLNQGNGLKGIVYVHPTANVSHSRLRNCIVQVGAEVADADLADCVIYPSASVVGRSVRAKLVTVKGEHPLEQAVSHEMKGP
jgi:glucose-1-phosphate thymidylyltransferase